MRSALDKDTSCHDDVVLIAKYREYGVAATYAISLKLHVSTTRWDREPYNGSRISLLVGRTGLKLSRLLHHLISGFNKLLVLLQPELRLILCICV